MRETIKYYKFKVYPRHPKSLEEFADQLKDNKYDKLLNYELNSVTAVPVRDDDGNCHIVFYDKKLLDEYFKNIQHMFIDATFQTRPKISDCQQLLNVLAVLHNCVKIIHLLGSIKLRI